MVKTRDPDPLSVALSRDQVAKLLRVAPPFVTKLKQAGHLHVDADGLYPLADLVIQYGAYREARVTSKKLELHEKLLQLKTSKLQREELEWRREVLPVRYMTDWMTEHFGKFAGILHGLGGRITRDVELRRTIEEVVDAAIKEFFAAIRELEGSIKEEEQVSD
jgi:hypothetical protein